MTDPTPPSSYGAPPPGYESADATPRRAGWLGKRQARVAAELERNRAGNYTVPTWALVAGLVLVIAAWAALIVFG